jgi:hypothetical protein
MLATSALGCTFIREVPGDGDGGGNNATPTPTPPTTADMLVMVQIDRSAGNLAPAYGQILGQLEAALGKHNIELRRVGYAPLHRRAQQVVPLIFGRDDAQSEFGSAAEAIAFYASDGGAQYIRQTASGESENLAALGLELDERAVYRPTSADPTARAYFQRPADGLIVLTLSATARLCNAGDQACRLNGERPGQYFVSREADGDAAWLVLPGDEGLPPERIFHAAIVTAEGVDYEQFRARCLDHPNFPTTYLDFMEGSPATYWGPVADAINQGGGHAAVVDMCQALSSDGDAAIKSLAGRIAAAF